MKQIWLALLLVALGVPCASTLAQQGEEPSPAQARPAAAPPAAADAPLTARQQQVGERFRELERLLLRMAELTESTDPRRSALLRRAVAQSKDRAIDQQFDTLVELLRAERLSAVVKNQQTVQDDLARLLELLLSEDRTKRIKSEKEQIREYLQRVNKIIRVQKGVQNETQREGDAQQLTERQAELADETGELAEQISSRDAQRGAADKRPKPEIPDEIPDGGDPDHQDHADGEKPSDASKDKPSEDGKPQDGKPPVDPPGEPMPPGQQQPSGEAPRQNPAQQRLERAQERMREAEQKLKEAERRGAAEQQEQALRELERAKAELEEILRQLREEEMSRTLAMLEARFRKMLDAQIEVYEGTKRLDAVPGADRDRDDAIEAGRLSRKEAEIAIEAEKALGVLREEGSAVAFPEAVGEIRDDMITVRDRLAESKVGEMTLGLERDIIAALEEMITALEQAQKEMEDKANQPPQNMPSGDGDTPLVDTLAELRMIRALQMRVNTRTQRYVEMVENEQVDQADLLAALRQLAEREQRIHKVTRDIVVGRNR